MEMTHNSKLTQMIEDAESNLKTLVEQYNVLVNQLQQLQQAISETRDTVLRAEQHYKTLLQVNDLQINTAITNNVIKDFDGNILAQSKE